jgi:hypothetical protein
MSIEVSGDKELLRDLRKFVTELPKEMRQVASKGALNIKNDWRNAWRGIGGHAKHVHRSIGYDIEQSGFEVEAEIGVERGRPQWGLGHLFEKEYGSVRNAPRPAGLPALKAEEPRFVKAMGDAVEKLLAGR